MTLEFLSFIVVLLTIICTLNVFINIRLIQTIKYLRIGVPAPQNIPLGTIIPAIDAKLLNARDSINTSTHHGLSQVWLFLSSKCDKCKSKLPEVSKAISRAEDKGLVINIISQENKRRLNRFLTDDTLQSATLIVERAIYEQINPTGASPFYMFIDDQNELQAQGTIGDENWSTFIEQLAQQNE